MGNLILKPRPTDDHFVRKLIEVYNEYDYKSVCDVGKRLIEIQDPNNREKKSHANGHVCEAVLRILTEHYLHAKGITGSTFQSMILKDVNSPNSNFRTELDFTVLTPWVVISAECKSYYGDLQILDPCTIHRNKGNDADVAKQHIMHAKHLAANLKPYMSKVGTPICNLFCFVYSTGTLSDQRTEANKKKIPVLHIGNLFRYYDAVFAKVGGRCYDYEKAQKAFYEWSTSKKLKEEHRAYLGY